MAQSGCRMLTCLCKPNRRLLTLGLREQFLVSQTRGRKRWHRTFYKQLYWRRIEQGPEPERPRSAWINWNFDAEVFAFGQRLKENFSDATLKKALTSSSYVEKERILRQAMEIDTDFDLEANSELTEKGGEFASNYIKAFMRHSFPALPEEGICSVTDYLLSDDMLAHIGSNLGIKDLILCSEFPPSTKTISECFKAVIGGLIQDQGTERACRFVKDFIITMLVGKDIMEIWDVVNPMGILQSIVQKQQRGSIESRLLYETGVNTVMAAYMVGVYSDKELLGKGFGETVPIAEEMAARDALRKFFGTTENCQPLPFDECPQIDYRKMNASIKDYVDVSHLE